MTAYNDFSDKNSWNVLSLLRKRADDLGEQTFIEFDNGVSLSFGALEKKSNLLALRLQSLGLQENENVFCFLKNCPEFLISLFAINARAPFITSPKLWGGMLVAIPTAMPPAPFTSKLGYCAGKTTGSFSVSS